MDRLTSSADGSAQPARPTVQEISAWLLHTGSDQSAEGLIVAAEQSYVQLRTRLVVSLGALGFDALWNRATHLALRQTHPHDRSRPIKVLAPGPHELRELVRECDPGETHDLLIAILASFFSLLVTFIGENLTFRIIHQLWPALLVGAADPDPAGKRDNHE